MPFTIQDIEDTPNPNALKFVLDKPICNGTLSFLSSPEADSNDLVKKTAVHDLFAVTGVVSLMFRNDFLTVNKRPDADWGPIKAKIRKVLASAQPLESAGF